MIREPIDLAVPLDQLAVRLVGKQHLRQAGDDQRIHDARAGRVVTSVIRTATMRLRVMFMIVLLTPASAS